MATARHAIREMREAQDLSIRGLARLAGVDHTYLSRYEKGEVDREPSRRWLRDVARALGTNLAELEKAAAA